MNCFINIFNLVGKRTPYQFGLGKREPYGFGLGELKKLFPFLDDYFLIFLNLELENWQGTLITFQMAGCTIGILSNSVHI